MKITREIGIDMGHRVYGHLGKCQNLHGHRYTIQATVFQPQVVAGGHEDGMIMDFGFLKDVMMAYIDAPCDHGTCLSIRDPELSHALGPLYDHVRRDVAAVGWTHTTWRWGKLYVIKDTPTAENLAYHWFNRLLDPVLDHIGERQGMLHEVTVWETPNCHATYTVTTADLNHAMTYNRKATIGA